MELCPSNNAILSSEILYRTVFVWNFIQTCSSTTVTPSDKDSRCATCPCETSFRSATAQPLPLQTKTAAARPVPSFHSSPLAHTSVRPLMRPRSTVFLLSESRVRVTDNVANLRIAPLGLSNNFYLGRALTHHVLLLLNCNFFIFEKLP